MNRADIVQLTVTRLRSQAGGIRDVPLKGNPRPTDALRAYRGNPEIR